MLENSGDWAYRHLDVENCLPALVSNGTAWYKRPNKYHYLAFDNENKAAHTSIRDNNIKFHLNSNHVRFMIQ